MSLIDQLKSDIESHGEVHALVEEVGNEVEFRQGTTSFDDDNKVVSVDDGQTTFRYGYDRVVSWYLPVDAYHD